MTAGRSGRRSLLRAMLVALALSLLVRAALFELVYVPTGSMAPTLQPGDHVLVWKPAYGLRLPLGGPALLERPEPRRGDVVVFRDPRPPGDLMVKRVVGLAGDVVELREQTLFLNGVPQPRQELGELTDEEPGEAGQPPRHDTCRRWRERLALGPLSPGADEEPVDEETAWARAAAAGVVAHEVLQCRRLRAGRREGPFGPVAPGHLFVLGDNRDRSDDGRSGGWQVPVTEVLGRATWIAWSLDPTARWLRDGPGLRSDRLFKPVE